MQRMILTLMLAACTCITVGQTCGGYYYLQDNKTFTVSISNDRGEASGKYVYKILDVINNGGSMSSTVLTEVFDEKDKNIATLVANMKCSSGTYMRDMKIMLPPRQAERFKRMDPKSAAWLEYPAQMKVGDTLKDASFSSDIQDEEGMGMHIEMNVTDRKVDAVEKVTTPAGTWKCYRLTLSNKLTTMVAGVDTSVSVIITEWFAPGFGVIITESKWGRTELSSIL